MTMDWLGRDVDIREPRQTAEQLIESFAQLGNDIVTIKRPTLEELAKIICIAHGDNPNTISSMMMPQHMGKVGLISIDPYMEPAWKFYCNDARKAAELLGFTLKEPDTK